MKGYGPWNPFIFDCDFQKNIFHFFAQTFWKIFCTSYKRFCASWFPLMSLEVKSICLRGSLQLFFDAYPQIYHLARRGRKIRALSVKVHLTKFYFKSIDVSGVTTSGSLRVNIVSCNNFHLIQRVVEGNLRFHPPHCLCPCFATQKVFLGSEML